MTKHRQTFKEHVAEINANLEDPDFDGKNKCSFPSWLMGVHSGAINIWKQLKEQGLSALKPLNVWSQIHLAAYLCECIGARSMFERGALNDYLYKDLQDSRADSVEEFMYMRTNSGSRVTGRMVRLQRKLAEYNRERNGFIQCRLLEIPIDSPTMLTSAAEYKDYVYVCSDQVVAFQVLVQEVLDELYPNIYYVEPWTLNQSMSVFATVSDCPDLLHPKPVAVVCFEFIEQWDDETMEIMAKNVAKGASFKRRVYDTRLANIKAQKEYSNGTNIEWE